MYATTLILIAVLHGQVTILTQDLPDSATCHGVMWEIQQHPPANLKVIYCAQPGKVT